MSSKLVSLFIALISIVTFYASGFMAYARESFTAIIVLALSGTQDQLALDVRHALREVRLSILSIVVLTFIFSAWHMRTNPKKEVLSKIAFALSLAAIIRQIIGH